MSFEGDGYIRIGTSTNKIGRAELDEIYHSNFQKKDRKSALIISPHFGFSSNEELATLNVMYLDISIENSSNCSIDFDVEMKVMKNKSFDLISEKDLLDELNRQKTKKFSPFDLGVSIPDFNPVSFHTDIEESEDHLLMSRSKMRYEKTAVTLAQTQIEKDIFDQNLLVILEEPVIISVEVLIRSDDFTEGPLIASFEVNSEIDVI